MPTNKNAFLRFKILDQLLSESVAARYSMSDLTARCNEELKGKGFDSVSRRCLEKDLEFLQQEFGNIKRTRAGKSTIVSYESRSDSIFNQKVSQSERKLLQAVSHILGRIDGLSDFDFLKNLSHNEELDEPIISFETNSYLEKKELLPKLLGYIEMAQSLRVSYKSIDGSKSGEVNLLPRFLKQYNNRWFLFANVEDGKVLTFSLDQFKSIKPITKKIEPAKIRWADYFEDIVGVSKKDDDVVKKILFWASDKQSAYIRSKPIHSSQKEMKKAGKELREKYAVPADGHFFEISCIVNYELKRELSAAFGEILVLQPQSLSKAIHDSINEMNKRYACLMEK